MSAVLMKDRLISDATDSDLYQRFHTAVEAAASGEPFDRGPADDTHDDHLLRVLIVDDYQVNADTLSSLVTIWGHNVRHAYCGVTGLALAAAFRPDVLLLDILMANMTGIEVATQVRRQERLNDCFIVAITGRTDEKHRCRCYEAGVDLCLIKPVVPSHLQTLLTLESRHVLSRRNSRRQRSTRSLIGSGLYTRTQSGRLRSAGNGRQINRQEIEHVGSIEKE